MNSKSKLLSTRPRSTWLHGVVAAMALWGFSSKADWGIWDAGVFLNINSTNLVYTNAVAFNGAFLGNFLTVSNHTLVLKGGEIKTFKNSGSDVTGGNMYYRIYPIDTAPGAFTSRNLPFFANLGGGDQVWQVITNNINVLAGLTKPGTYRIQVYFSADGTVPNETRFFSNMGANYTATFNWNIPVLTVNGINANYTTTKFFADEVAGDSFPVEIVFWPNAATNITNVEIFSNLNRRDLATLVWTNADGIVTEEGIFPRPGNTISAADQNYYFRAYPMNTNVLNQRYSLTLPAEKTGAYRLSARYKMQGNTNWFWYTDTAMGRRDHAIVVSPITSRDIVMYEVNTLNIKATGTLESQRSTFVDLWDGPGSDPTKPAWNLDYVRNLGVNWLWFQPVHPYGVDGRHLSAADINDRAPGSGATTWLWNGGSPSEDVNYAFQLGSPYAVKNFWEIEPRMSKANTRPAAMTEFTNFVEAADQAGVSIMLDAAFNHTSWDTELGELGVQLFATNSTPTTEIRNVEARFFSRDGNYALRATSAGDIAPAPDRFDFGKWLDVKDVFFGRYAALVPTAGESGRYLNEEDWFDYTKDGPGYFDQITQNVWKYFGAYVPYWLEKTGYPAGTNPTNIHLGIDGLRCDFGQGLPPQAWEYIINRARSIKWNFVFMAETLDGGAPPYRSNRHFDILNENILFAMKGAGQTTDYRSIFEDRRNAFGQGLVLLNTVSHDEDNYDDPWQAFIRYALCSSIDGAPMIFPGQELGISTFFGYDLMEKNFGKYIPHFKTWNSMMPLWSDTDFGNDQLYPAYAAVGRARNNSPALRSSLRWFINQTGSGDPQQSIFSVAKYETPNASPAVQDVVFAFVNLNRNSGQQGNFNVNIEQNGSNLFGIKNGRTYNVRNIAAYNGQIPDRDLIWLWNPSRTGADILGSGIYVTNNPVPSTAGAWTTHPYEAQFLKLYDVTAPPAPTSTPVHVPGTTFVLGTNATFSWGAVVDPEGLIPVYRVIIDNNGVVTTGTTTQTSFTYSGNYGDNISISIVAENPNAAWSFSGAGPSSQTVALLDPEGDEDEDGLPNWAEVIAGTDLFDASSVFVVEQVSDDSGNNHRRITVATEPGRLYTIYFADGTWNDSMSWSTFANLANGIGTWLETNTVSASRTFVDDESADTTGGAPAGGVRNYRFNVEAP
ncbi:MAG TPA: alpha-amylase family glycosyl hydrolase [Kiritimatiellia bacterium]|nr:alpha-amylase family glycosyl hydrolase [Kiritimatiellia bacterium]